MKINSIITTNWKVHGRVAIPHLTQRNWLTGASGSGKSAITDAVRVAIEGRVSTGASVDKIAEYMTADHAEVAITFDDGFAITRQFSRDANTGSVETTILLPGVKVDSNKHAEGLIREHVGDYSPRFDLHHFRKLTPNARRDEIVRLVGANHAVDPVLFPARWTIASARQLIDSPEKMDGVVVPFTIEGGRIPDDMAIQASQAALRAIESDLLRQTLIEMIGTHTPTTCRLVDAITERRESLKVLRTTANDRHQRAENQRAACAGRVQQINAIVRPDAGYLKQIPNLMTERDLHRDTIARATERAALIAARNDLINRSRQEADTIGQARALEDEADLMEQVAKGDQTGALAREQLERAQNTAKHFKAAQTLAEDRVRRITHETDATKKAIEHSRRQIERFQLDPVYKLSQCLERVKVFGQRLPLDIFEQFTNEIDDALALISAMGDRATMISREQQELETHAKRFLDYDATLRAAQKEAEDAGEKFKEADTAAKAITAPTAPTDDARAQLAAMRDRNEKTRQANARILELQRTIDQATRERDEMTTTAQGVSVELLQNQLIGMDAKLADVRAKADEHTASVQVLAEYENAITQAEKAQAEYLCLDAMIKGLDAMTDAMMSSITAPLTARIDGILTHQLGWRSHIRLHTRTGKPTCIIGITRGERFIPFDALSDGEQIIFGSALTAAAILLNARGFGMMIIDLSAIDPDTRMRYEAMITLGAFDQVEQLFIMAHRLDMEPGDTDAQIQLPIN